MISFIKGNIEVLKDGIIIIENNGIGYRVNVSENLYGYLCKNKENVKLYTFMNVKEDDISLFGFLTLEELELFERLITVSGVGPKGAISLLNVMSPQEIISAIITSDIKALSSGQGIGKKIAQRIALELKDKVDILDAINIEPQIVEDIEEDSTTKETLEALVVLGFTKQEILKAINSIEDKNIPVDKMISLCLKKLSK
ncbi:Holliday junction branch migration protein RuvA [uncultured Tyzzerella sp.]|uniref:Holliday junction branch migration protein RuvA n=1 Tax=uncultured Tyzzerella sp. TaxID=2321398 RepID=UPI002942CE1C|nr:Holliday junction branch migration protein RuvA [uncultured Tyzzerella sp.]